MCHEGYAIYCTNGRDIRLPVFFKGIKRPFIKHGVKEYELLYLLMEGFGITYTPTDKVTYVVMGDGRIPVNSIKITPIVSKDDESFKTKDDKRLSIFKCEQKAASANIRGLGKLTAFEILECLKFHKFKCFYCDRNVICDTWHLDHFIPISKGGLNKFSNIVPACPICNKMKSDICPYVFKKMCEMISKNNKTGTPI